MRLIGVRDVSAAILSYFFENEAENQRLYSYVFAFQKDREKVFRPAVAEPMEGIEEDTALSVKPGFEPVTNADFICRDCIYRIPHGAPMVCHKFAKKPNEVLTEDRCPAYRKELGAGTGKGE